MEVVAARVHADHAQEEVVVAEERGVARGNLAVAEDRLAVPKDLAVANDHAEAEDLAAEKEVALIHAHHAVEGEEAAQDHPEGPQDHALEDHVLESHLAAYAKRSARTLARNHARRLLKSPAKILQKV